MYECYIQWHLFTKRREKMHLNALGLMYSDIIMCSKYFWGHYKHKRGHSDLQYGDLHEVES